MEAIKQKNRQVGMLIILIGCLLLFGVPFVDAQNNTSDMSVDELVFIQGIVKYVSLEKKRITVKPSKEEKVRIYVDEQTDFIGIPNLEKLTKEQWVKIWYTPVGDINIAVTVEKLPDLGC